MKNLMNWAEENVITLQVIMAIIGTITVIIAFTFF